MNVTTKMKAAAPVRPDLDPELNNLAMSKEAQPLFDAVKKHIEDNVAPISDEFFRLGDGRKDAWSWAPGQLELLEVAKNKAKASGLWNFFLPHSEIGRGLTNLDYAYIAAELGKQPLASVSLNCSAPDTGNMEVLEKVGTPEQKEKWLKPLLNGEIRSAYAMTEPNVAPISDEFFRLGEGRKDNWSWAPGQLELLEVAKNKAKASGLWNFFLPHSEIGRGLTNLDRCACSATITRRAATCTSSSRMSACPGRTSCWARAAASRSRRSASDRAASIIACARSAPPRRLST